jgi:RNA polymerase sigma factor (sigma-70 family)
VSSLELFLETRDFQYREQVFNEHKNLIIATRARMSGGIGETEDLDQEGTIALCRAIDTFNPIFGVQFKTYAIKCLRNCYMKNKAKLKRKMYKKVPLFLRVGEDGSEEDWIIDPTASVEDTVIRNLECERVRHMVSQLPDKYSQVLELKFWQGFSTRECSEVLLVSRAVVAYREKKALKMLKNRMVEDPFHGVKR